MKNIPFIKKADILLIVCLILTGIAASVFITSGNSDGRTAIVSVDGKEYASYSLLEDRTFKVRTSHGFNTITIKDGSVSVTDSDCPGRVCINQGRISQTQQTIVCLPHRLMIKIEGGKEKYDSISK